jgi:hypothetical protein
MGGKWLELLNASMARAAVTLWNRPVPSSPIFELSEQRKRLAMREQG